MQQFKRIFVVVCDSVGVGEMPDAAKFGDEGTNTFVHTAEQCGGLNIPNLNALGVGDLANIKGTSIVNHPHSYSMRMREASNGKDTMTGHWEMMGIYTKKLIIHKANSSSSSEVLSTLPSPTSVLDTCSTFLESSSETSVPLIVKMNPAFWY